MALRAFSIIAIKDVNKFVLFGPAADLLIFRQILQIPLRDLPDGVDYVMDSFLNAVDAVRQFGEDSHILSVDSFGVIVDRHPLGNRCSFLQAGQPIDAGVQVVLDGVEVALVVVRDLGRNHSFGDLVDVFGGDIQRSDNRIQRGIDALDDLAIIALMVADVGASGQLASTAASLSILTSAIIPFRATVCSVTSRK